MITPREAKDAMSVVMNEFGLNSATAVRKEYPASWGAVVLWDDRDGKVTTNKLVAASVCRRLLEAASRRVAELEERLATSELEAKRLRAGMQALQDWAVRERDEAWATEKVAVEQGVIPGPLDWPHRKGAALLHVVGCISKILAPQEPSHD